MTEEQKNNREIREKREREERGGGENRRNEERDGLEREVVESDRVGEREEKDNIGEKYNLTVVKISH